MVDESRWLSVPVGADAERWMTRPVCRHVVVAVHTVTSGQRLLDVVRLVESDPRIQLVYTSVPDVFDGGVREFLRQIGAMEIPWQQATRERFDLALTAGYGGLPELHAPVIVLPHGAGYAKQTPRSSGRGQITERGVYGLTTEHLVRDGRVVPASIVLSHHAQQELLTHACPPAAEVALVAGDPCYDRLYASLGLRRQFRDALDVDDRQLVVVASTWGRHSLFARHEDLLGTVVRELDPCRYRVAALIHPAVWFGHGRRQVRAWLAEEAAGGLILVEPDVDWRGPVIAADYVIGDHGSVPVYAASIGVPVLHTDLPVDEIDGAAPQAYVGAHAPRLIRSAPIESQLSGAAAVLPRNWADEVTSRLTSKPGQSNRLLRQEMYRLLDLDIPGRHRGVEPIVVNRGEGGHGSA